MKRSGFGVEPLPYAQEQIQEAIQDVCLSLNPKDWFNIADPISVNVYVDLPPKARLIYNEMEKTMFAEIEAHPVEAVNAAARTLKCLQIANGAAYVDPSGVWKEVHDVKLQALESVIEEAGETPVIVAYHFKSDLARLRMAFPAGRTLDDGPNMEKEWNQGRVPILFIHPASAGHGLNLQHGGNIIVFFAHNWNLEEYEQAIERIGPMRQLQSGYDRPVYVYHIIARRTVDEMVMERRESKAEVQDILMAAMRRGKHLAHRSMGVAV